MPPCQYFGQFSHYFTAMGKVGAHCAPYRGGRKMLGTEPVSWDRACLLGQGCPMRQRCLMGQRCLLGLGVPWDRAVPQLGCPNLIWVDPTRVGLTHWVRVNPVVGGLLMAA